MAASQNHRGLSIQLTREYVSQAKRLSWQCLGQCYLFLAYPMGPVHGLQVLHGVPVVLHKYDGISPCQIQSKATCGEMGEKNGL